MNYQNLKNTANSFEVLTLEELESLTAKELLEHLIRTSSLSFTVAMALKDPKITFEEICDIRIQIAKTIWRRFPLVAKRKGLRKFS